MAGLESTRLGDYELIERIGKGGMAEVYRARQLTAFGREVALKVVRTDLSENEEFRTRFLREAQAISRLSHPNILPLIECGEEEGRLYLVTPLARAGTLLDLLQQRKEPLSLSEAGSFFVQLCSAVQYAHEEGIIHRDIKPQNILLQQRAYVLLADFGIARDRSAAQITAAMSGVGTVEYMAPEQAIGQSDTRSDIYSLGVVLYLMLTGHLPYEGSSPLHILARHSSEPLPDPREYNPGLPPALVEILQTALAKEPGERFQSARALGNAVQQVLDAAGSRSRPGFPAAAPAPAPAPASASQQDTAANDSISPPTVADQPPAPVRTDALATQPGSGGMPGRSEPEGQPSSMASQPAPFQPPASYETRQIQNTPLAYPGPLSPQPASPFAPPAAYTPGPAAPGQGQRKRGRALLFGLLAAVIVVAGTGILLAKVLPGGPGGRTGTPTPTAAPTQTIPAGFRLYTSPDHSFRVIYPTGWTLEQTSLGNNGTEFAGPAGQDFTAVNNGPAQLDAGTFDDSFCTGFSGGTNAHTTITLAGHQWTREACDAPLGLGHAVSEGTVYKGNLYVMIYTDLPDQFNGDQTKYFSLMEQSFTFLT